MSKVNSPPPSFGPQPPVDPKKTKEDPSLTKTDATWKRIIKGLFGASQGTRQKKSMSLWDRCVCMILGKKKGAKTDAQTPITPRLNSPVPEQQTLPALKEPDSVEKPLSAPVSPRTLEQTSPVPEQKTPKTTMEIGTQIDEAQSTKSGQETEILQNTTDREIQITQSLNDIQNELQKQLTTSQPNDPQIKLSLKRLYDFLAIVKTTSPSQELLDHSISICLGLQNFCLDKIKSLVGAAEDCQLSNNKNSLEGCASKIEGLKDILETLSDVVSMLPMSKNQETQQNQLNTTLAKNLTRLEIIKQPLPQSEQFNKLATKIKEIKTNLLKPSLSATELSLFSFKLHQHHIDLINMPKEPNTLSEKEQLLRDVGNLQTICTLHRINQSTQPIEESLTRLTAQITKGLPIPTNELDKANNALLEQMESIRKAELPRELTLPEELQKDVLLKKLTNLSTQCLLYSAKALVNQAFSLLKNQPLTENQTRVVSKSLENGEKQINRLTEMLENAQTIFNQEELRELAKQKDELNTQLQDAKQRAKLSNKLVY